MSEEFAEVSPLPLSNESLAERQRSNEIEDMTETGKVHHGSVTNITDKKSEGVSAKTFTISKSQQASAYAIIERRKAESRGVERGKTNLNMGV